MSSPITCRPRRSRGSSCPRRRPGPRSAAGAPARRPGCAAGPGAAEGSLLLAASLLLRRLGRRRGLLEVLQAELQLVGVELLRAPAELPALQLPDQEPQLLDLGLCRVTLGTEAVSRSACNDAELRAFCCGDDFSHLLQHAAAAGRDLVEDHPAPATWRYSTGRKPGRPALPLTRPCSGEGSRGAGAGATASPRAGSRAAPRSSAPRLPPARAS